MGENEVILDLALTRISLKDYMKIKPLIMNGFKIDASKMDYAKAVGLLCLLFDLGVPLEKTYVSGGLNSCLNVRNIEPETPYAITLSNLGISFVVKSIAA